MVTNSDRISSDLIATTVGHQLPGPQTARGPTWQYNTQHDLSIYLSAAEKYGESIRYIIIRKVIERKGDEALITKSKPMLEEKNIKIYYASEFPHAFEL